METFKTALVVILLLAVLGGVYVVLNEPSGALPQALLDRAWAPPAGESSDELGPEISFGAHDDASSHAHEHGSHSNTTSGFSASSAAPASGAVARLSPPSLASAHDNPAGDQNAHGTLATSGSAEARLSDLPDYSGASPNLATASFNAPEPKTASPQYGEADHDASHAGHSQENALTPEQENAASGSAAANAENGLPPSALTQYSFRRVWNTAQTQIDNGHMAEALLTLSTFYQSSRLDEEQTKRLLQRLDQLAGTVIYSREHRLELAYKVQRGETLYDIAERHRVPWRLLANINGIKDPELLLPGQELKVLRGPFRAEIDLQKTELTLYLGQLYGGRFPLTLGVNPAPRPGRFTVLASEPGRTFFDATGKNVSVGHPDNPYGNVWLDLGDGLSLHGNSASGASGCLSLGPRDAGDVYGILAKGSRVDIR